MFFIGMFFIGIEEKYITTVILSACPDLSGKSRPVPASRE
jgi:hypothetical protein